MAIFYKNTDELHSSSKGALYLSANVCRLSFMLAMRVKKLVTLQSREWSIFQSNPVLATFWGLVGIGGVPIILKGI